MKFRDEEMCWSQRLLGGRLFIVRYFPFSLSSEVMMVLDVETNPISALQEQHHESHKETTATPRRTPVTEPEPEPDQSDDG